MFECGLTDLRPGLERLVAWLHEHDAPQGTALDVEKSGVRMRLDVHTGEIPGADPDEEE